MYFANFFTLCSLLSIYAYETFFYSLGFIDMTTYVRNLINKGSKHNVLLIKIAQSLMGFGEFPPEIVEILKQNTHSVQVLDDDVDIIKLERIKADYNIQLLDEKPFHSGMIGVVYLGLLNDKKVIIKVRRTNITERIEHACKNINFMYNLVSKFSKFNKFVKSLVLSMQSITQTTEYLLLQCNFEHEINAMRVTQNDIDNHPLILKNICIPKVYNKPEDIKDTNFIIMEYFDGVFSNDLKDQNEKTQYLEELLKYATLMGWFFTYYHTDIHCGNVIYMKDEDILKVGIIDFGMVVKLSEHSKEGLRYIGDIHNGVVTQEYCYKCINYIVKDRIDYETISTEQKTFLNDALKEIVLKIGNGTFDEKHLLLFIDEYSSFLKKDIIVDLEMFLVLISANMVNSTIRVLAGYDNKIIDSTFNKIMLELAE